MSDDLDREFAAGERWPGLSLDDGLGPAPVRDAARLSALVDGALSSVAVSKPWWRRKGTAPLVGAGVIALSTAAAAAAGLGPRLVAALSGPEPEQVVQVTPQVADARLQSQGAPRALVTTDQAEVSAGPTSAPAAVAVNRVVSGGAAENVPHAPGATEAARHSDRAEARAASTPAGHSAEAALPASVNAERGPLPAHATPNPKGAEAPAEGTADRALTASNAASPNPPTAAAEPRTPPGVDARATPEDLLGRASALRKAHSYKQALAVYELILARYPGTRQSAIARVAAAQIELSQFGDARTAQRRFQEAQGDAELGPEALFGLAEACRAQADVAGERKALSRLLKQHPESPLAAAARKRLASGSAP